MKRTNFIYIFLLLILSVFSLYGQKIERNSSVTGVCLAGNKVKRIYIPPPDNFLKKSFSKGSASVTFYYSGFSTAAKVPMEYAASILESVLPPGTKVTILATYAKISTSGVLANSSITGYSIGSYIGALDPSVYYPVALAEKIYGDSLNSNIEGDITLTVNNSINWYFGTDGNTPSTKYDLVTVVLHELCHGLGFYDSFSTSTTSGSYGISSVPFIYDTFIENLSEKKLTDTLQFNNSSAALRSALTSGRLYFNGPLLMNYTSGKRAKVYAPSIYESGSSVSHLDEDSTSQVNSLMTPYIDRGEAIHNPGDFTMSILGDLGWINTKITHKAPGSTEENLSSIELSVTVKSDTVYNHNKVGIVYSYDNFHSNDTIYMSSPGADAFYTTSVTIPSYNTELKYFFLCKGLLWTFI